MSEFKQKGRQRGGGGVVNGSGVFIVKCQESKLYKAGEGRDEEKAGEGRNEEKAGEGRDEEKQGKKGMKEKQGHGQG